MRRRNASDRTSPVGLESREQEPRISRRDWMSSLYFATRRDSKNLPRKLLQPSRVIGNAGPSCSLWDDAKFTKRATNLLEDPSKGLLVNQRDSCYLCQPLPSGVVRNFPV